MMIIGIDPAPSKVSTLFSGHHSTKNFEELSHFLSDLSGITESVLICWDAPLTGPANPDSQRFTNGDHTQRAIESFFRRGEWDFKAPSGISVLGYASCPHWAMTRRLLGLPRVGRWDAQWTDLPFQLIAEGDFPDKPGHYIVEVHPALALWLWCGFEPPSWRGPWNYKQNGSIRRTLWQLLREHLQDEDIPFSTGVGELEFEPSSDDELDAFVAWVLGMLWARKSHRVMLLGNRQTGSMLLPTVTGLKDKFDDFLAHR